MSALPQLSTFQSIGQRGSTIGKLLLYLQQRHYVRQISRLGIPGPTVSPGPELPLLIPDRLTNKPEMETGSLK